MNVLPFLCWDFANNNEEECLCDEESTCTRCRKYQQVAHEANDRSE